MEGRQEGYGIDEKSALEPDPDKRRSASRAVMVIVVDLVSTSDADATLKILRKTSNYRSACVGTNVITGVRARKIDDVFALDLSSGSYPLGAPLPLATLQGKPLMLTVK